MRHTTFGDLKPGQRFHPAVRTKTIAGARMWIKKNHKAGPLTKYDDKQAMDEDGALWDASPNSIVLTDE